MDGVLVVDKPAGMTSHDVVHRLRKALKTRRIGHTGTLDPMATGVLPVAVGEGTRTVQFLMEEQKGYRATLRLGETTDTQDAEGQVLERRSTEGVTPEAVLEAARRFVGTLRQIPPMYSALKKDGVPLYKLARKGIEVEREPREVEIARLEILEIDLPSVTLEVDCSKGTYIRTLAHDLGQTLGCGAHLTALRRIRSGRFLEGDALPLAEIERRCREGESLPALSLLEALAGYPALEVHPEAAQRLGNGIPPLLGETTGTPPGEGATALLLRGGRLLAAARFAPGREVEKRGDFELLRVFNTPPGE